jgi:hypothetical protein
MSAVSLIVRTLSGLALVVLMACTPRWNWRQGQLDGVSYWSPCKPEVLRRSVPLAGVDRPMTLAACDAGGATWAVGAVPVRDPADASRVLDVLRRAAADNLGADEAPAPQASAARLRGRRPGGQAVILWAQWRASPGWAVQASVLAAQDSAQLTQARAMFFGDLPPTP